MFASVLGFVVGSLLGATDGGLLLTLQPRWLALVLGDLAFGAAIGASQWLAVRGDPTRSLSPLWIPATGLGFTIGARSGARLAQHIVALIPIPLSTAFGLCMGTSIGAATLLVLRSRPRVATALAWLMANALAWVLCEAIAFSTGFSLLAAPLVGLTMALVTWAGLTWVRAADYR